MARSMTGYGKAEVKTEYGEINTEIRSLNNRYLDIGLKLPKSLSNYELAVKELIKKKIMRGKLTVTINFKDKSLTAGEVNLNSELIEFYHNLLKQLKEKTRVGGEITIDHLLQFKELFELSEEESEDRQVEEVLLKCVDEALDRLNAMREKEAVNISKDINKRLKMISSFTAKIRKLGKKTARAELQKMKERIRELVNGNELDENRLEQELALIADRVDITEESTRIASHVNLFQDVLNNRPEVGKKLTFILQEMHREANTIGSKTSDVEISHLVISMKEEIEKLREQVQNLE